MCQFDTRTIKGSDCSIATVRIGGSTSSKSLPQKAHGVSRSSFQNAGNKSRTFPTRGGPAPLLMVMDSSSSYSKPRVSIHLQDISLRPTATVAPRISLLTGFPKSSLPMRSAHNVVRKSFVVKTRLPPPFQIKSDTHLLLMPKHIETLVTQRDLRAKKFQGSVRYRSTLHTLECCFGMLRIEESSIGNRSQFVLQLNSSTALRLH